MPADNPNPETKQVLEITDIMAILPHRHPFLLIDRVIERERMKRIVAIKNVTINEPFFTGHFPGYPIMPGVLVVEAMAQAGGLLLLPEVPDRDNKLMVFTGIERAKFRKPVSPGDQLRIEVVVMNWRVSAARLEGKAFVDGKLAGEAVIVPRVPPAANRTPEQARPVPPAATETPVESAVLEAVVPE
jgi:3-hydroxyacyl-[acyl-carrier-protein] dehydratase